MRELERTETLPRNGLRWNFDATLPQLHRPPEQIYDLLTDFRRAHIIPGITNATLIQGTERQKGAVYSCTFAFKRGFLSLGTAAELEVTHAQPPLSAGAIIRDASLDGILQVSAQGCWNIEKGTNGGNDLHFHGQGSIAGHGISMFERLIRQILAVEIEKALFNMEREINSPQPIQMLLRNT